MRIRRYSELVRLETHEERFQYLSLGGVVGTATFGFDRWINQRFYRSREWGWARRDVIARDLGCDLGVEGYEIHSGIIIHHMNPVAKVDILEGDPSLIDPEFLITTTIRTHNAIHYGDGNQIYRPVEARTPGDTKLW
jgi:hypothetical protein